MYIHKDPVTSTHIRAEHLSGKKMSFKVEVQHSLSGFLTSCHEIPIGTLHCLPLQYIINLVDIVKTAEWVCQSVKKQCDTHDTYN